MATTKTIKSAGGDYSSLATAIAGESSTTGDIIFDCFALDIGAGNTDGMIASSLTIKANASARQAGVILADVTTVARTSGAVSAIATRPILDGLLFTNSSSVFIGESDQDGIVQNCQFTQSTSLLISLTDIGADPTYSVLNCVFYGTSGVTATTLSTFTFTQLEVTINQCSIVGTGTFSMGPDLSSPDSFINGTIINSAAFGAGAYTRTPGGQASLVLNSCAGVTGGDSGVDASVSFLATTAAANYSNTTSDARLKTTAPMKNTGNTGFGLSTDIIGTHRPQGAATDIGVFETIVLGGVARIISPHRVF